MNAVIAAVRRRSPSAIDVGASLDINSGHPVRCGFRLTLTMSWPSDSLLAMLRPRTGAVVCLAVAAVVTAAVRETPAGIALSPSALSQVR
jgi:hypothetical protein